MEDHTDLSRSEDALKEALAYAGWIISTLRGPFVVLDKHQRVKTANEAFYRTFRVGNDGCFVYELDNGSCDVPCLRTLLDEVLSDQRPLHDFEVEQTSPGLEDRSLVLNASRFEFVDGGPDLILLAIEDITERKQALATKQTSEIRYRQLFENAQDGIVILDADTGQVLDSNPFMTALLGYSHDEFLGKELWEIGLFRDITEGRAAYRRLQEKGGVSYENLTLETRNGQPIEVEFVSNVYAETDHRVVQCNIRDISERSRLEKKMNEQAAALADLERRKDEFLAMLSHELRNPLTPLVNAVEMLKLERRNENPIQQQARTVIDRQVGQFGRIVEDLLEVARISAGKIPLCQARLAVSGVVQNAVTTVRSLVDQRQLELTVSLPIQPIWVYADATRLEQVVVNLLNNAAKYTDAGGRLWLTVQLEGDEVLLRVRDTGIGIDPEILPRIFDLFTQANRSLDRSPGGLGIGLALVKQLVEMHRGTVAVQSVLGQGSEFVVRLLAVA